MKHKPVTPLLTVDIIIQMDDRPGLPILLIERRNPPFGWALPGGFVDVGESVEHAAVREAKEETSLSVQLDQLLGVYSDPQRDNRGHTVGLVYIAHAQGEPTPADDAIGLRYWTPSDPPMKLAFDHELILADYREFLAIGKLTPLRSDE